MTVLDLMRVANEAFGYGWYWLAMLLKGLMIFVLIPSMMFVVFDAGQVTRGKLLARSRGRGHISLAAALRLLVVPVIDSYLMAAGFAFMALFTVYVAGSISPYTSADDAMTNVTFVAAEMASHFLNILQMPFSAHGAVALMQWQEHYVTDMWHTAPHNMAVRMTTWTLGWATFGLCLQMAWAPICVLVHVMRLWRVPASSSALT